jgi:hypothetical protein
MDSRCAECGIVLPKGTDAVWDRGNRLVHCLTCAGPSAEVEALEPDPGLAGASARREYERRKERDETRLRQRWGALGSVAVAVAPERQSTRAWAVGARGEETLAASLAGMPSIRMLHDRAVRGTRGNIDHLVIGPAGVFVVDAKNYRGRIRIRDKGGLLRTDRRLYVGGRDCSKLADGLRWQVEAVASALLGAEIDPLPSVTPVLCFIDGDWPLLFPPSEYNGVRLEGVRSLRKLLMAKPALDQPAIDALARSLGAVFPPK